MGGIWSKLIHILGIGPKRQVHLWIAAATIATAGVSMFFLEGLRKDVSTTFSSITGFATLYGIIFAAVEVVRLGKAADAASAAAMVAVRRASLIVTAANIAECQNSIDTVLDDIDKSGLAGSLVLSRIIKIYAAEFSIHLEDDSSEHRQNISIIRAYISSSKSGNKTSTSKLRSALVGMTVHLVSKQSSNAKESYK